jgi:hypothetical protein
MDSGVHVPETESQHGIVARPDVLIIAVSARVEDLSPLQAVTLLKSFAAKLQNRASEMHPRAHLSARKLDLGRTSTDKSAKATIADSQIDGVLHVPLDDALDFWGRAELVAKITESLRMFSVEAYKSKPSIRFGFRSPAPRVQDVSAYKTALTNRYANQWRALTGNGEKMPGAGTWEIPDEVAQYAVSLEEVRLVLVSARKFPGLRES